MKEREWNELVEAIRNSNDGDRFIAAAERLRTAATAEDLPRLMKLLKTDHDFHVAEVAVWPASELGGPAVLPELLERLEVAPQFRTVG